MHSMRIQNSKAIKEIKHLISEQWGDCPKLDYVFLRSSKNRIYLVTRDIEKLPEKGMRIDTFGLYFGEILNGGLRLSIEGAQLVGVKATKGTFELDDIQVEQWFQGLDIEVDKDLYGFLILFYKKDIVGCGHCKEGKISNYMPKNRRIKEINPT